MIISFNDKNKIKEQIFNGRGQIIIKFSDVFRFRLTQQMMNLIKSLARKDRKFIKNLLNSQDDFMFFIYQISNNLNK